MLAITDHDIIDGAKELIEINKYEDIVCISGVELDAVEFGVNFHILGYGVNLNNEEFKEFVNKNRGLLEEVNIKLIEKMEKDYSNISLFDYKNYEYNRSKGGWKALHCFIEKGLTKSLFDGFGLYGKYEHSYTCVNFPTIKEVCEKIHIAGGKAILAHPGKVIKNDFIEEVTKIIECGIDGIECYYPSHSKELTDECIKICKKHKLLVTSGSDCHGDFEKTEIGEMSIRISQLELGELYCRKNN